MLLLIFLVLLDTIIVYFIVVRVIGFNNLQLLNNDPIAVAIESLYCFLIKRRADVKNFEVVYRRFYPASDIKDLTHSGEKY